jgi:hypothetical protein
MNPLEMKTKKNGLAKRLWKSNYSQARERLSNGKLLTLGYFEMCNDTYKLALKLAYSKKPRCCIKWD